MSMLAEINAWIVWRLAKSPGREPPRLAAQPAEPGVWRDRVETGTT